MRQTRRGKPLSPPPKIPTKSGIMRRKSGLGSRAVCWLKSREAPWKELRVESGVVSEVGPGARSGAGERGRGGPGKGVSVKTGRGRRSTGAPGSGRHILSDRLARVTLRGQPYTASSGTVSAFDRGLRLPSSYTLDERQIVLIRNQFGIPSGSRRRRAAWYTVMTLPSLISATRIRTFGGIWGALQ